MTRITPIIINVAAITFCINLFLLWLNINSTKDYQKRVNKNQKEYLSFDEKIKSFLESAKATKNYINKFSAIHKEMIMKINDVKKYEKMSRNPGQKMNEN